MLPVEPDEFGASRYQYVYPPDGSGIYGIGNVAECDFLTCDGAGRIRWGGVPEPETIEKMRCVHLCPTRAQLRTAVLPPFLAALPHLRTLGLPAQLLPQLRAGAVPPQLPMLVVDHDGDGPVPEVPLALDAALPGLRGLMFVTAVAPPHLTDFVSLPPTLEFLHTNVSGSRAVLDQVRELRNLRHLELRDVRGLDVFADIRAPLRALEIAGADRDLPVERLATVPTLRAVRLNGVRAELDCAVFQALPELTDLTVLNSKRVSNVEALLDCPKLRGITFVNCANPFKKDGKTLFKSRGFARLDIDYS